MFSDIGHEIASRGGATSTERVSSREGGDFESRFENYEGNCVGVGGGSGSGGEAYGWGREGDQQDDDQGNEDGGNFAPDR